MLSRRPFPQEPRRSRDGRLVSEPGVAQVTGKAGRVEAGASRQPPEQMAVGAWHSVSAAQRVRLNGRAHKE
jgi:hypothetical protein